MLMFHHSHSDSLTAENFKKVEADLVPKLQLENCPEMICLVSNWLIEH